MLCCLQLAGVTAAAAEANGMEVDGQQPAASTSGRKLFVGSQELGYRRPHMEVRVHMCMSECHVKVIQPWKCGISFRFCFRHSEAPHEHADMPMTCVT